MESDVSEDFSGAALVTSKRAEELLQRTQRLVASVLKSLSNGINTNDEGEALDRLANDAWEAICGASSVAKVSTLRNQLEEADEALAEQIGYSLRDQYKDKFPKQARKRKHVEAASPTASIHSGSSAGWTGRKRKRLSLKDQSYDDKPLRVLPDPPLRHPSSGHYNRYDQNEPINSKIKYDVRRLLDRRRRRVGKEGAQRVEGIAYLVQWETRSCQLTWVWKIDLKGLGEMTKTLDEGKTFCATHPPPHVSATRWFYDSRPGAGASPSGRCFLKQFKQLFMGLVALMYCQQVSWRRLPRYTKGTSAAE